MFSKNWLRLASAVGLLIASVSVVAQSMLKTDWGNQLYFGTSLIAVFGYLFLTSRTKEEERDSPWWW
jgi:type III secretory pathway component EscS